MSLARPVFTTGRRCGGGGGGPEVGRTTVLHIRITF